MQPCKNFQIFDDGEGPLNWGCWFHIPIMSNSQAFFCACGLVEVEEEGKGRGQELIVTYFHASKFQELIPIMISHLEAVVCF